MAGKPKPEDDRKSALLSCRVKSKVKAELDAEARKTGKSLSKVVERHLLHSLAAPKRMKDSLGDDHVRALAYALAEMVQGAETTTDRRWHEDRFTFEMVRSAFGAFFESLAPGGEAVVPPRIEDLVARSSAHMSNPAMLEFMKNPEAQGVALGLGTKSQLDTMKSAPVSDNPREHFAEGFHLYPFINKSLGRK